MECSWLLLVLISAVAVAFISEILGRRPHPKLPPGPKSWPIIGNLNLLGSVPHQSLHRLSQKYGEIMLLNFGKFPVVVASSPEMAKQFLKVHDAVFASRPTFAAYKYISYDYSDVGFAPYGPYWRGARKLLITELLSPKKLESLELIRIEERRDFLSRLRSQSVDEKPVVIRDHIFRFTLSIICRMVLRDEYMSEPEQGKRSVDMDELQEMLREWFVLVGAFNIGDWIPWLGFLDLQGYVKKMKCLRRKMDRFTDYVIDDHLAKRGKEKGNGDTDFVDILLQIAEDPNSEVQLTKDCVRALILNVLEGGTDTAAATIEWAMHEIVKQPHIIEKAKEELDRVIGRNRWVEESDFIQLPYMDAIIMETFRLHPTATLLSPRYSTQDCVVAGYHISKGITVLVNTWSMGRDPSLWGEAAEEFLPERFVGKEIELMGSNNFVLLPFGSGRRRCPAYNLGLRIVRTMVANLLHGFDVKLEEGMRAQDICMDENYGLTTSPKHPLSIVMKPALPDYLY